MKYTTYKFDSDRCHKELKELTMEIFNTGLVDSDVASKIAKSIISNRLNNQKYQSVIIEEY